MISRAWLFVGESDASVGCLGIAKGRANMGEGKDGDRCGRR